MIPILLASFLVVPPASPPVGLRLEGSFLQYSDSMTNRTFAEWRRELDAARAIGLRTIIIQWLSHGNHEYMPAGSGPDPTEHILRYADAHGLRVFVGLRGDEAWWSNWKDAAYLDALAAASERIASLAWKRYGHHRAFAGWYIPTELWDAPFTDAQIAALRRFFRSISTHCKSLAGGKPVAIAPFFSGLTPPKRVSEIYAALLTDSNVDVLMLQDGVGARGWDTEIEERVVPYYQAFRDACLAAGVELWSDLECFRLEDRKTHAFGPAPAERILEQLAAEAPFVRRFVTFDFFHYMSPSCGKQASNLYYGYKPFCADAAFLPVLGRSMQVDPTFVYYRDRSPESIADEIRAAGYSLVHYVVVNDTDVDGRLVEAFRRRGIGVWYVTFGNGTYRTSGLPPGWEEWRMVTRSDLAGRPHNDGYTRLCLNNPAYRAWKKSTMAKVLTQHAFIGVDIAEPHWPEYPGIASPAYACFCKYCRAAFLKANPDETDLPDILDPASPRHPSRSPELWAKWLRFRQVSLTDFLNDLVNGPDGLRQTCPDRKVCTWTLALLGDDGMDRVRELHGEDAAEIVRIVKPDVHCLQTHWPDWMEGDLEGDYVRGYKPYLDAIRRVVPNAPVVLQADIGSQKQNRRSWAWVRQFENACRRVGAQGAMSYEYFIGGYMYDEPPRVVEASRVGDSLRLVFNKRLDPATAGKPGSYEVEGAKVTDVEVDGNVVKLRLTGAKPGSLLRVTAKGIADAADRRLFDDRPPCVLDEQTLRVRW